MMEPSPLIEPLVKEPVPPLLMPAGGPVPDRLGVADADVRAGVGPEGTRAETCGDVAA